MTKTKHEFISSALESAFDSSKWGCFPGKSLSLMRFQSKTELARDFIFVPHAVILF